jgi:hypothetical protein
MVRIFFADERMRREYEKLSSSREFSDLFRFIQRAIAWMT